MKVEGVHKYGKFWIDDNTIFNFQYHPGVVIDIEAAKYISNHRKELFNGKRYPVLVDGRGLKFLSKEAAHYFSSEENTSIETACALLADSFLSRIFGKYYLKIFPPKCPSKLFTNKNDAIKWLLKFQ